MKGFITCIEVVDEGGYEELFAVPPIPNAIHQSNGVQLVHNPDVRVRVTVEITAKGKLKFEAGDIVRIEKGTKTK